MSICTQRATGAAAVSCSLNPGRAFQLEQFTIHLSAAGGAGNLTITLNAGAGAVYDALIVQLDMTTVTDYVFQPTRPMFFEAGDTIDVAWANANIRTYGLEIKYSPL